MVDQTLSQAGLLLNSTMWALLQDAANFFCISMSRVIMLVLQIVETALQVYLINC